MSKPTFFDMFAGVGGFRLAFQWEGFEPIGWCEIDKWCRKLYRYYYKPDGEYFKADILTIDPHELPDFDVITAGAPCQPFSVARTDRQGLRDYRGLPLWKKLFEIIKVKRPKVVVIENVKGLLSSNRGWDFAYILHKMDKIGYDVEWDVLNSKDFGVPQNRERVFVIGHLRGESRPEVFPLEEADRVYYELCKKGKQHEEDEVILYSPYNNSFNNLAYCLSTKSGSPLNVAGQLVVQWRRNYLRVFKEQDVSLTLTANMGTGGLNMPLLIEDVENIKVRKLTPLECFRLQGFPDDIVHMARKLGISDSQLYKMAGNAVTVPVAQSIARKIRKVVFSSDFKRRRGDSEWLNIL